MLQQKYVIQYLLPLAMTLLFLCLALSSLTYMPVDFFVYYDAARQAFTTENIYAHNIFSERLPDEGLPFVYTPFTLLLIQPFTLLPPMLAWVVWTFVMLCGLAWALRFLARSIGHDPSSKFVIALFLLLSGTTVIAQHLAFGQINILLAVACLYDLAANKTQRISWLPRGLLTGIAAGIKLTPAFFLFYLLATRQFRAAIWMCAGGLGTLAIGAVLFPVNTWHYLSVEILSLSDKVDLGSNFATSGNNSISGALAYFWADAPLGVKAFFILGVAAAALATAYHLHKAQRTLDAVLIAGASIQLLSPVSWIHHWVFLVFIVLRLSLNARTRRWGLAGLLFLLMQPTDLGDWVLTALPENIVLSAIGIVFREGLLLLTLALGIVLARPSSSFEISETGTSSPARLPEGQSSER